MRGGQVFGASGSVERGLSRSFLSFFADIRLYTDQRHEIINNGTQAARSLPYQRTK